jgi:hypothetical protein
MSPESCLTPNRSSSLSPSLPYEAVAMPVAARALDLYHTKKVELDDVFNVSWSLDTLELGITLLDHVQQMEQRKTKGKTKVKVKLDLQSHARPPHRIYLTPA